MRFDDRVTGKVATYAPNASKIHVDIDASEINKKVKVDVRIVADLERRLLACERSSRVAPRTVGRAHAASWQGALRAATCQQVTDAGRCWRPSGPRPVAAHRGQGDTGDRCRAAPDVGGSVLPPEPAHALITSGGLGTMGFALPAGIGAAMGRPDDEVWAIAGDGGFQMTVAELATAAQEGVKINMAILNNGYLGMVRQWQEFFYDKRYKATPMMSPDFVELVEAYGMPALRVPRAKRSNPRWPGAARPGPVGDRVRGRARGHRVSDGGVGRGPARHDPTTQAANTAQLRRTISEMNSRHTITALVENSLACSIAWCSCFAAAGFNIER